MSINKDIITKKKSLLNENFEKYKSYDKLNKQIELADHNGDSVNINSKGDLTANQYLIDKQVYELFKLLKSKIKIN